MLYFTDFESIKEYIKPCLLGDSIVITVLICVGSGRDLCFGNKSFLYHEKMYTNRIILRYQKHKSD